MKILIVDDDFSNLSLMKTILVHNGYAVAEAANGENALKILKSEPIDLIISDILMPVMDGYRLCQTCKADNELQNIPFIFCLGTYTDKKDEDLSVQFGADAFIVKPFESQGILQTIARVMETSKKGKVNVSKHVEKVDPEVYKLYSERLVSKLEDKMLALDKEKMALEMEVAERRKVEERLRKSRDFAESLFHAAPGIVLILDTEGRIVRFNPYMEKVSGYLIGDVKGQYWREVFSPEDTGKKIFDSIASKTGEDIPVGNVSSIITRTGEKKEILWFDSTLKDETGKAIGLLAVGREITRRETLQKGNLEGKGGKGTGNFSKEAIRELDEAGAVMMETVSLLETEIDEKDKKKALLKKINQTATRIRELTSLIMGENSPSGKK